MSQKMRIAINGFGRIGRKIVRLALEQPDSAFEIVAINDLTDPATMAHLLQYDSVHGKLPHEVTLEGKTLRVGSQHIALSAERDPAKLPWKQLGVEYVHECTGAFTDRERAALHLQAGARKVIISAPSKDADATFCVGVNTQTYDPTKHHVISNASCTTNCLAPVAKILDETFGIEKGTMLTIHSYTNDQQLLDLAHKDLRRARAAALSQIPTTTGAAKAVGLVLPNLKGKLDGLSIRVPTANVSVVDFTGVLKKNATREQINAAFQAQSQGAMKGILGYSEAPLVSCDFNGTTQSSTVDAELTTVLGDNLVKVIAWYDNESGFSARMLDLTRILAKAER